MRDHCPGMRKIFRFPLVPQKRRALKLSNTLSTNESFRPNPGEGPSWALCKRLFINLLFVP